MKTFIYFFKFAALLLATDVLGCLLVWHPWTFSPKATLAATAQSISHARPTAADLGKELQARQEKKNTAKGAAIQQVIQRFHPPVHNGYPVISTIDECNALPPGAIDLTTNGQYELQ